MMGSPLIIGCDLRKADEAAQKILKNEMLIAIDQDEAYRQPFFINSRRIENVRRVGSEPLLESYPEDIPIMARLLSNGDIAIGAFNFSDHHRCFNAQLDSLGLGECTGKTLEVTNVWTGETTVIGKSNIRAELDPHCCVGYRARVIDK